MRKPIKSKKSKVPKLTEEEYVAYISSLKEGEERSSELPMSALTAKSTCSQPLKTE